MRLAGVIAVLVLVSVVGSIAEARAPRETIRLSHGRAFVPRTGDWEGSFNGFPASFELISYPRGHRYGAAGYGIENLTEFVPASCPVDPSQAAESLQAAPPLPILVARGGVFPFHAKKSQGRLQSATRATVNGGPWSVSSADQTCKGAETWSMHPATRRPVTDGNWSVHLSDGSTQPVTVSGGGRVIVGVGLPSVAPTCNGSPGTQIFGGADVFIPPGRNVNTAVARDGPETIQMIIDFSSPTAASGRFVASQSGCTSGVVTFTMKRA